MTDLTGQNLRRFRSRDDDGGFRVANEGRSATPRPIRRLDVPITQPFPVVSAADDVPSDDHVEDLIAGYALGALDSDEKLAVERHADYCARCARLLADTRRTAAMLPYFAAPAGPSPDVKAALFARIAQSSTPVTPDRADDFAWARPVSPQRSVSLPASGNGLESQPSSTLPVAGTSQRTRRSFRQLAAMSVPVLLTFGLLALFVVPQMLPSNEPENPQLVDLLSAGSTECTPESPLAFATSASIVSACGRTSPATLDSGVVHWTLLVNSLRADSPEPMYQVNIPTMSGGYAVITTPLMIDADGVGDVIFVRPKNAGNERICITELGEDPNLVCPPEILTPAA